MRVTATFTGVGSSSFLRDFTLRTVGASNVAYGSAFPADYCGVIPDDLEDTTTVFTGGTISGNVCWSVLTSDAASLMMYESSGSTPGPFFALR